MFLLAKLLTVLATIPHINAHPTHPLYLPLSNTHNITSNLTTHSVPPDIHRHGYLPSCKYETNLVSISFSIKIPYDGSPTEKGFDPANECGSTFLDTLKKRYWILPTKIKCHYGPDARACTTFNTPRLRMDTILSALRKSYGQATAYQFEDLECTKVAKDANAVFGAIYNNNNA